MQRFILMLVVILFIPLVSRQQDTAVVLYYNVLNFPGSTSERVNDFRTVIQFAKPDIILITELNSEAGADLLLSNGMNVFGTNHYSRGEFIDGPDTDGLLFYNHEKFTLYSQDTIQTQLRNINEYVLYSNISGQNPVPDTTFLYFYVAHLKASTGSTNQQQRLAEVMRYKSHVDSKTGIENMFFGGDLNLYTASEPAYDALLTEGNYPLTDVLPAGNWNDNSAYAHVHTQSTRTIQFGGGASGGLDDRFDFILFTGDVISGSGNVTYIPETCIALGNDGQHLNKALTDTPVNTTAPDSVIQALYSMSDHLPVICKLKIQPYASQQSFLGDFKILLEGPFVDTAMITSLNPVIPLYSPYEGAPWFATGGESVAAIPNPDIVDWILLELRDAPSPALATPNTSVLKQSAFLLKDGSIVGLDGLYLPQLGNLMIQQSLYVVIWHRNHVGVIGASPAELTGNVISYDFTTSSDKAYLNGQKEITTGIWGMLAGDTDASGEIDSIDKAAIWNYQTGQSGYLPGDLNFDTQVANPDKNDFIIINQQGHSNIPE